MKNPLNKIILGESFMVLMIVLAAMYITR
jgi:hypothetical protein